MNDNEKILQPIAADWQADIAFGKSATDDEFINSPVTLDQLKAALGDPANHRVQREKGLGAFLQGTTKDGSHEDDAVESLSLIVLDVDGGTPIADTVAATKVKGLACAIYTTWSHSAECAKYRAVFILARPWTRAMGKDAWKNAYRAFGQWLGVEYDPTCVNVGRLFYLPSHAKGTPFHAQWIDGQAVDIFALPGAAVEAKPVNRLTAAAKATGVRNAVGDDLKGKLLRWAARNDAGVSFADAFQIADFIEANDPDLFRPEHDREFKRHVQCAFEHEHTKPGGGGTYVMNAGDGSRAAGFVINCQHAHCADRDRLDFLAGYLDAFGLGFDALCDLRWYADIEGLDFADLNAIRDGKPTQQRDKASGRRVIYVGDDWPIKVNGALQALSEANTPPKLFKFADRLSRVFVLDSGRVNVVALDPTRVRHEMKQAVQWLSVKEKKNGEKVTTELPAPLDVCQDILATPSDELPFPVLDGLAGTPFFTKGGKLHTAPGYDPASRIYYQPLPGFSMPAVSAVPTDAEVERAKSLLLDEVLHDFPFDGDAERANAVAMILLPFVRQMIDGPTPLHWIDKPTPGTGASKLVNCVSLLALGSPAEPQTEVSGDDEWRKKLTTALMTGGPLLFIDNINKRLDSPSLATAVTALRWNDRLLGSNTQVDVPIRSAFIIAGNNVTMSSELLRRCVRIRLDAKMENPENRTAFKHAHLEKWIKDHRGELVWACLTLAQSWIAKGCPAFCGAAMGSFEEWSRTMGGILEAAGIAGFLANRVEVKEKGDTDKVPIRLFLSAWYDKYREAPVTVSGNGSVADTGLYGLTDDIDPPLPLPGKNAANDKQALGKLLGSLQDRRYDLETAESGVVTVAITNLGNKNKAKVVQWCLKVEESAA